MEHKMRRRLAVCVALIALCFGQVESLLLRLAEKISPDFIRSIEP
jgi:hypothetical protein